jgi:hypothetical protein
VVTWFKIKGKDSRMKSEKYPDGIILEFHVGAQCKEQALKNCQEKGIIEIEYCHEDPGWEPGLEQIAK